MRNLSSQWKKRRKRNGIKSQTGRGKTFRPDLRNNPDDGTCDVKLSLLKSPISVCDCVSNSDSSDPVTMQVTGQETALAASDESSQTAKVKEVTSGEGEGADGQMKEVENNVPDQSNEPSTTTGSKTATPSKEAPNSK